MGRIVCRFSCGAASACATKLVLSEQHEEPVVILNSEVVEEHPDNKRFLADCEKWFGQKIVVIGNDEYNRSIYEVFRRGRWIKNRQGAPCSRLLKRDNAEKFLLPDDTVVLGYTVEEQERLDRFIDANNGRKVWAPLIEKGMTKQDCLGLLAKVGIELPMMYRLGYHNNNCVGCVKGGRGYWNKIRVDFPEVWERMAQVQDLLGNASGFWPRKGGGRITLRELPTTAGRHEAEQDFTCGAVCEFVEQILEDADEDSNYLHSNDLLGDEGAVHAGS